MHMVPHFPSGHCLFARQTNGVRMLEFAAHFPGPESATRLCSTTAGGPDWGAVCRTTKLDHNFHSRKPFLWFYNWGLVTSFFNPASSMHVEFGNAELVLHPKALCPLSQSMVVVRHRRCHTFPPASKQLESEGLGGWQDSFLCVEFCDPLAQSMFFKPLVY